MRETGDPAEAWYDYVEGVVKLMIWHVWDLHHDSDDQASLHDNLDRRIDIMRKTTLFDDRHPAMGLNPPIPEWDDLKTELADRIARVGPSDETAGLAKHYDTWKARWTGIDGFWRRPTWD